MKYSIEKQSNYAILTPDHENLNSLVAPEFKSELVILHNEGIENLIIDFTKVKYVDSSGLSAILTANRLWKSSEGTLVLSNIVHSNVKKLIEISRLDSVFTILPSINDSVGFVLKNTSKSKI